ncbi:GumC family protein [Pontibacter korlensis]|nr:tyrosine-protein kinase [Pontibacter korlensis]
MDKELFPLSSERAGEKDIRRILLNYLRYWYLFLIGAALGLCGAFLYLRYYTIPKYSVYSTVLIKDDKSDSHLSNESAFSDLEIFQATKNINNEIEVLQSESLMKRVASELSLFIGYYIEGRVNDIEIYGSEVPIKVLVNDLAPPAYRKSFVIHIKSDSTYNLDDNEGKMYTYKFGQQIQKPYGVFTVVPDSGLTASSKSIGSKLTVKFKNVQQLAEHYSQAIQIGPVNKSASVLWVGLTDPIPEKAKDIVNKLIEVYNKEAIEDKNLIASYTIDFIDERLRYLTSELSGVEKDVEQYKRQHELTDVNIQASNYLNIASGYNKQLSDWAIQIEILESIESYLNKDENQYKMVPSTLSIQDVTLMGLIARFNELQLDRERMLRTAQPKSPIIKNLNEQLANIRSSILENLRNIKKGLLITSNNLRANSDEFESKIKKVPSMERELLEISRQQAIKQNLYLYLLQKREETALSLAATVSSLRVIDPAKGGNVPVSPNKSTIYLMSLLLGICLPFAGIFIKDLLDDKVQTQQDVQHLTIAPVLGELPHNNYDTVVVTKGNRTPIVEMFRHIRAKLHFAAVDKENKVILITSSMSGEGKTFFAINLAASLVLTGKKVLLIDLDLRKSTLSDELGLSEEGIGVSDYLVSNNVPIHEIIRSSAKVTDLFVISSGPTPPDPTELMMSTKLADLILELKSSFDFIIIDTAPVGQVADALSISSVIDSTIYIVRYNYTKKRQIEIVDEIYRNKTLCHPMIVLNDSKHVSSYGYGYGYCYSKEEKKDLSKKLI